MEPPGLGTEPPQDGDEPGTGVAWGQSPAGGGRGDTWGWGQGWILPGAGPGAAAPYPGEIFSSQRQQEDVEGQLGWHRRGGTVEPTPRPCPHPGANGDPGAVPMRPAGCAPPKPHRDQPHGAGLSHGPVCHRELGTRPRYPLCPPPPVSPSPGCCSPEPHGAALGISCPPRLPFAVATTGPGAAMAFGDTGTEPGTGVTRPGCHSATVSPKPPAPQYRLRGHLGAGNPKPPTVGHPTAQDGGAGGQRWPTVARGGPHPPVIRWHHQTGATPRGYGTATARCQDRDSREPGGDTTP